MKRRRRAEWMDASDADPGELRRSLRFIRRVNAALGYTRRIVRAVERVAGEPPPRSLRVLDVGAGSADVAAAIVRWGRRRGVEASVVAIDLHAVTLAEARRAADGRPIAVVRADALALPVADGSVDIALCSLFLHHFDEADAARVLRALARTARIGVVVADLHRRRRALAWITLLTLLSGPMVRHDARWSVRAAWTTGEMRRLLDEAGLPWMAVTTGFAHQIIAAGRCSARPA